MTWSYDLTDLATNQKDQVRLYLQDNQAARPLLQDEEIQFLLDTYGGNYSIPALAVAAMAADLIVAKYATRSSSVSADGVSIGLGDIGSKFKLLAEELRSQYEQQAGVGVEPYAGGILRFEIPDFDVRPHEFAIGMNDNPEGYAQAAWANGHGWGYGYWGEEW